MFTRTMLGFCIAMTGIPTNAPAQSNRTKDLSSGSFLVAQRDSPDPNFAETVVLLVDYGEKGAMGLIINRQTRVPLSRIFAEMKEAKDRSDKAYLGGPVSRTGVLALLRSSTKPEDAQHVFADIHLISSKALLEKTLESGADATKLHVYLGYSGWGGGQLDREVELGVWHIFRADANMVFDPDPESVWTRMIRRAEMQIASSPWIDWPYYSWRNATTGSTLTARVAGM